MNDPHITEVSVENTGSHAIESAMFDSGRPIRVPFGAKIASLPLSPSVPASLVKIDSTDDSVLLIGPELIQVGSQYSFQVLTEGKPDIGQIEDFVVGTDVDLRTSMVPEQSIYRRMFILAIAAVLPAVASALINIVTK